MISADRPATRLATRLAFLVAGFGVACWAPLIPYAKARLAVDDGVLGLLLLCLGIGSVVAMLMTGMLSARYGSKPIIIGGAVGMVLFLPLLSVASTPLTLGLVLFVFGGSLGSLDVAMNIHAVEVEKAAKRPLMSGFHGLYSVGGFIGSIFAIFLLSVQLGPLPTTLVAAALMLLATLVIAPRLLTAVKAEGGALFALPRGFVLLLAVLTAIVFLVEGAVLDWGALYLTGAGLVGAEQGGMGYMVFSIAMTVVRLAGDAVVGRIGDRATLFWGSLIGIAGFALVLVAPVVAVAMAGFLLVGIGLANIVPVLFRRAGNQTVMPAGLAVAAVTTAGYAGVLLGPAGIGFVAKLTSLPASLWMLTALLALVTLTAGRVAGRPH
ncbi:MFS transporter [Pleomorphomonas diazotrophica]|uniref:MFS transporter n=1 Tax=Pleomorphomonas diazotrophica TaxID=1166257 RepID=A0A1I4VDL8_9HYPH|nr:MFS transporter [Pleomorphomonas diazotrophica]PKR91044.1 MFS transporter [Pleomorphomonas diazotrophica]SFM99261.1 Fucose permease [Pleomorphomonas diazotrophica]